MSHGLPSGILFYFFAPRERFSAIGECAFSTEPLLVPWQEEVQIQPSRTKPKYKRRNAIFISFARAMGRCWNLFKGKTYEVYQSKA